MAARGDPSVLRAGTIYKRRQLHEGLGLGGNWQKGISYPAVGDYALIFSDPDGPYADLDGWESPNTYVYSGEWSGKGDMRLTGGNLRVVERTPNLYLFVAEKGGMRCEGRFELEGYSRKSVEHDGAKDLALIFRLKRAAGAHLSRPAIVETAEDTISVETEIRLRRVVGGVPASLRSDAYTKPGDAARLRALQEKARQGHRDLLVQLVAAFSQTKVRCSEDPFSVDLLVQSGDLKELLIEVKTLGRHEVTRVRAAVAQLYEYAYRLRAKVVAPILVVAVDRPLTTKWLRSYLLEDRRMTIVWADDGELLTTGPNAAEVSARSGGMIVLR